jgi:DNA mismatch repair protein MutS
LPQSVVERAQIILSELEAADRAQPVQQLIDDLPLFAASHPRVAVPQSQQPIDKIGDALDEINPDELSPREALEKLYALKKIRAQ